MVAFLLTVVILGALIFLGYCLTLYLYSRGAVGVGPRLGQPVVVKSAFIRPPDDVVTEQHGYGVRYARIGILISACLIIMLVVGLLAVLAAML